nr:hypothetical protein BaRGS_026824 [Batillaria attramentaria]
MKEVTNGDVQRFLKDILKPFTEKVNIVEDGLLDALLASQVLTDIDNESLNALHHPTRTERARHLWKILHGIDHDVFIQKVLPVLCEKVGFIIPGKLFKTAASDLPTDGCSGQTARTGSTADKEKVCTRCAIVSRDRPEKLADFLYRIGMIDFKTHGDLTAKNRTSPTDWDKIFNSFRRLQRISASRHQKDMKQILSTDSLRVPDDLVDQMMKGFPCRCRSGKRPPSAKTLRARREELTGICTLCENLLVLQRTFILCSVYLNMPLRVQTDRTREKTGTVCSHLDFRHEFVESKNDVEKLMKAILEPFVSKVEIHESGLLDALIARNVINDIDNESLDPRNRGNRRERARFESL